MVTTILANPISKEQYIAIGITNQIPYFDVLTAPSIFGLPLCIIGAMVGIAILIAAYIIINNKTLSRICDEQLKELNVDLTIVGICFWLIVAAFTYLLFLFFGLMDAFLIETYGMRVSVLADDYLATVIYTGLNWIGYISLALGIWCALNITQMVCLAIDAIQEWRHD